MAGSRERTKYRKQGKTVIVGILLVALLFCGLFFYKTKMLQARDSQYGARERELQGQIAEERKRSEELEEREAYVQTKKYVEEIAKTKLGLVNPGETVLKPNEE